MESQQGKKTLHLGSRKLNIENHLGIHIKTRTAVPQLRLVVVTFQSDTFDSMDSKNADVLVIGAGMSGMTAAASLSLAGLKVRVLEARDRLGGRIHTHAASQQTGVVDLGASFVSYPAQR